MKPISSYPHFCLAVTGLACAVALLQPTSAQAQRRDFSAVYQFKDVVESEGQVSLTVDLKLVNYSGAEIHDAGIFLYDSSLATTPQTESDREPTDAFPLIPLIPSLQPLTLSHRFTVPKREYLSWQHGAQPDFVLMTAAKTADGQAGSRQSHIDLRRDVTPIQTMQQSTIQHDQAEVSR